MVTVVDVTVVRDRVVTLSFSDGHVSELDLSPYMWGPAFAEIATDDEQFAAVSVDPVAGTIVWPNGADLDPDVLRGAHGPAQSAPMPRG